MICSYACACGLIFSIFEQERVNKRLQSKLQVYGQLVKRLGLETELQV